MKHVTKGASPQAFEAWKALANANWKPTYDNLQKPEKLVLHESLLVEQGWVCCYCGRAVAQQDSHIEHFRPREQRDDLALSYENLLASCMREIEPGTPLHCGHAKGADFNETLHISPLDSHCEARSVYTLDGRIMSSDSGDARAGYMIDLLKLDIAFLRNRREEVVRRVFDPTFLATATDDELGTLREFYRRRDEQGRAQAFGHVLARFVEQRLSDAWHED